MYIITIILHYFIGLGILNRLGLHLNKYEKFGLAFPLGLGIGTLAILIMDITGILLTFFSTTLIFLLLGLLFLFPDLKKINLNNRVSFTSLIKLLKKITPVEWFFLLFILFFYIISFWRCFYLPITTYDSIIGIDLVAKHAAESGHLNSHLFSDLDGYLTTQPYYAPFTALSQTIYRLSGHDFGKIWLSFMFLSLLIVFYINLRSLIHPLLAGFLMIILISIPEMYAYTFMIQTDFSNAVFTCFAVIYFYHFIQNQDITNFWLATLLFGFAVFSRSETIAFAASMAVLIFFSLYFHSEKKHNLYKLIFYFMSIAIFFFAIWNLYYLPVVLGYNPESFFKIGFWDFKRLEMLWKGMLAILNNTEYWGYIFYLFLVIAVINILFLRDVKNIFIFVWIFVLFFSFLILLYHLQINLYSNIKNTFRRGTFKIWPMMVFYIGTSALFKRISNYIYKITT